MIGAGNHIPTGCAGAYTMNKYTKRISGAAFAVLLLGTGCSTYGDFGGSVNLGPVHIGGHIGWGQNGGGTAAPGSNANNSTGGGTSTNNTPVQKKSTSGTSTTGTANTAVGAYTGVYENAPSADGYYTGTAQNVRAGQY